jgi:hypothetical protein
MQFADSLSSEVEVDYTQLRDLLQEGKWQETDEETGKVMLKVSKREKEGWLRQEDIEQFPCANLRAINQLWRNYSDGRFGFSVQKRIWMELGGTPGQYDYEIWQRFGDRVGWRVDNEWLYYKDLTFLANAPVGHLPSVFPAYAFGVFGWGIVSSLVLSRTENCHL